MPTPVLGVLNAFFQFIFQNNSIFISILHMTKLGFTEVR